MSGSRWLVLVVDYDRGIADVVRAILDDEGYAVSVLHDLAGFRAVVGQLEPDCILLNGESAEAHGQRGDEMAWLHARGRPIPMLLFTTRARGAEEVVPAGFAGVIPKPFELDHLVDAVGRAVGRTVPFNRSVAAEAGRTRALVDRLEAAGAREVHASTRREWADFVTEDGTTAILYWWQRAGLYYVGRFSADGATITPIGQFHDLDAAIAAAVAVRAET